MIYEATVANGTQSIEDKLIDLTRQGAISWSAITPEVEHFFRLSGNPLYTDDIMAIHEVNLRAHLLILRASKLIVYANWQADGALLPPDGTRHTCTQRGSIRHTRCVHYDLSATTLFSLAQLAVNTEAEAFIMECFNGHK